MCLRLLSAAVLSAALLPTSLHAASLDNFSITGKDASNTPFSLAFQLPASYTAPTIVGGQTIFSSVAILVDGTASETGTINIDNTQFLVLNLNDPNFDNFGINSNVPFETLANGIDTFTLSATDQAAAYINCSVRLVMPHSASPVLAFLQIPTFTSTCPAVSNLAITGNAAPTATPEPSSFALLLLGCLALATAVYRRTLRIAA